MHLTLRLAPALQNPVLAKREDLMIIGTEKVPERYRRIFVPERIALPLVAIRYGQKWMVLTTPKDSQNEIFVLPFFQTDPNCLFLLTLCNATWIPGCEPTMDEKRPIVSHLIKKRWSIMEIVSVTGISETEAKSFIS